MTTDAHTRFTRITINHAVMNGQPIIRGTRISVKRIVEAAAVDADRNEFKSEYPGLTDLDIEEALRFAALSVSDENFTLEAA